MSRTDRAEPHDIGVIRKVLALAVIGVLTAAGLVASDPGRVTAAGRPIDVLFIGNSLLGTPAGTGEDTPDVLRRLASRTGRSVRATKVIRFGNTLQRTWESGLARTALNGSTQYDFIVLQEFSTLVATRPARAAATLRTYAPALARSLRPGGRVVLFKNWALTDPAPFSSRMQNVAAIDIGYARLAETLPLPVVIAPIGDAFEVAGPAALIVPDGKHPSGQAVYLDAAILYGLFFSRSPRDLPDLYVPPADAARLREAAATALA